MRVLSSNRCAGAGTAEIGINEGRNIIHRLFEVNDCPIVYVTMLLTGFHTIYTLIPVPNIELPKMKHLAPRIILGGL